MLADIVIPFNGVLVTRELVDRIGLPREEFFIWGDDVEYLWRASEAGARVATVVGARVLHPSVGELGTPMMCGRTTYNHSPSDLKHYCMARNNLVNLRDYRGPLHALAFVVKTLWFYTFTRPSPARLRLSAGAMRAGAGGGVRRSREVPAMTGRDRGRRRRHLQPRRPAGRMLDGLAAQTTARTRSIVVDNASTDHTRAVLDARDRTCRCT